MCYRKPLPLFSKVNPKQQTSLSHSFSLSSDSFTFSHMYYSICLQYNTVVVLTRTANPLTGGWGEGGDQPTWFKLAPCLNQLRINTRLSTLGVRRQRRWGILVGYWQTSLPLLTLPVIRPRVSTGYRYSTVVSTALQTNLQYSLYSSRASLVSCFLKVKIPGNDWINVRHPRQYIYLSFHMKCDARQVENLNQTIYHWKSLKRLGVILL